MKRIKYFLIASLFFSTSLWAQNNDLDAQYLYTQAENSYTKNEFEDCIKYLEKAVVTLGKTNPKILSLEFNAYQGLLDKCPYHDLLMHNTRKIIDDLNYFFANVDVETYPKEKYFEVKKFKEDYYNSTDKDKDIKRYKFEDLGISVVKDGVGLTVVEVGDGLLKAQTDIRRKFWLNDNIEKINENLKLYQDIAVYHCADFFTVKIDGNYGLTGGRNLRLKEVTYELKLPTRPK